MVTLLQLFKQVGLWLPPSLQETHGSLVIEHLTADSRDVGAGSLFFAISGRETSGIFYIQDAIKKGAVAVVTCKRSPIDQHLDQMMAAQNVPLIQLDNPRQALAKAAAAFYERQPSCIVAVTGTNGKSSTASFVRQIWSHAGLKAATLGTLGLDAPDLKAFAQPKFGLTMPNPVGLHKLLSSLTDNGISHLSVEASSHGLDQYRMDGVRLSAAAFTNLSQDHLDYHETMESYFQSKKRLFSDILPPNAVAVLNADVQEFSCLRSLCHERGVAVLDYGRKAKSIQLMDCRPHERGHVIAIQVLGEHKELTVPLWGEFQVHNSLCALGLALATGMMVDQACEALQTLQGIQGRLEYVGQAPSGAKVYVDYAHTPDAMMVVLQSIRPYVKGKIICVFGCGGDRDRLKRPLMGRIASELAEQAIVTDDNPRSEEAELIRVAIMEGVSKPSSNIADREEAIKWAIAQSGDGDVVLILGKGHEQGQIVGHQVLPFDDVQVARMYCKDGTV